MLNLPDITLFAIDCVIPWKTATAMERCTRLANFGKVVMLTDTRRHDPKKIRPSLACEYSHHEETDQKASPYPGHPPIPLDYEAAVLKETAKYVLTSHVLHVEWDSAVLNPMAWNPDWLKWDYIGAPWPPHKEPGWPDCTESNNVGNGGFSLKSSRFVALVREAAEVFKGDPQMISSDRWVCRTLRPWLEGRGILFAPERVAEKFSCENRIYSGQFGYHGKLTHHMNGWRLYDP